MEIEKTVGRCIGAVVLMATLNGCLIAAAGVGAEAGYVAGQTDRTASETLTDQYIVTAIKAKLLANSRVPGMDINVDSDKGIVTLRGALEREEEIVTALEIARNTDGVKDVRSKLVLVGD
jgi:osmotically-inducible protein OsmY